MKHLHFPVQILTHSGSLIIAAAKSHTEVGDRLPAGFVADADTLCQKVTKDDSDQKTAKGELGNLTAEGIFPPPDVRNVPDKFILSGGASVLASRSLRMITDNATARQ